MYNEVKSLMKLLAYLKKLSLVFIVLLLFLSFSSSSSFVFAQTDPSGCGPRLHDRNCNLNRLMEQSLQNGDNGFGYVYSFLGATIASINLILQGDDYFGTSAAESATAPESNRLKSPGLIATLGTGLSAMYTYRPIGGLDYLASLNPFKSAYAAGGDLLSPVLELWKIFRNLAYILIVLVLLGFGFLVMFRYKLDPRTVISVSDALPRVAVSLILITLSYSIVGLIIDGMKVVEGITFNTLQSMDKTIEGRNYDPSKWNSAFRRNDPTRPGATIPLFPIDFDYGKVFDTFFNSTAFIIPTGSFGTGNTLVDNAGKLIFAFLVMSLAVQLIFALLKHFATFFILAIFGPLVFLWSILPGQEETVRKWFMQLLTAALVFPAVFLFLNLAYFIGFWISGPNAQNVLPNPPAPGLESVPRFISGASQASIGGLIKVGILLITSKIPEVIEEALKAAPSGRVAGAGVDVRSAARRVPFIGGFLG